MTPDQERTEKLLKDIDRQMVIEIALSSIRSLFLIAVLAVSVAMFVYHWHHPELTMMQVLRKFVTLDF